MVKSLFASEKFLKNSPERQIFKTNNQSSHHEIISSKRFGFGESHTSSLRLQESCSITRAVKNERIINPALERTYLGAN